jgi:hypothetical protein
MIEKVDHGNGDWRMVNSERRSPAIASPQCFDLPSPRAARLVATIRYPQSARHSFRA